MALESEYSDDFDFMDIFKEELENLQPVMKVETSLACLESTNQ